MAAASSLHVQENSTERVPCVAGRWYVVRVKSNMERIAARMLEGRGIEVFLPLRSRLHAKRGARVVEVPLFSGYVFASFDAAFTLPVLTVPGVAYILQIGNKLAEIPPAEIFSLMSVCQNARSLETLPAFHNGEIVRIVDGPLSGVEASVVRYEGGHKLVVSIRMLQRSIMAEISSESVIGLQAVSKLTAWSRQEARPLAQAS